MTDDELPDTWDQLPQDVSIAIAGVLDNGQMPARALALYARWWQLETWLRSLAYVELRAERGRAWTNDLDTMAFKRQEKDGPFEYMASPDWKDPLAYLDASKLFATILDRWDLFVHVMPARSAWEGRTSELLSIRNRIGHLRRPHQDDLAKLEQTLRDLEVGAARAIGAYNNWIPLQRISKRNPIAKAFRDDRLTDATGLIEHAERRYDFSVDLSVTFRPWFESATTKTVKKPDQPGVVWNLRVNSRSGIFSRRKLWREFSPLTRQCLIHLLSASQTSFEVTFPAVEDAKLLKIALGDVLQAAFRSIVADRPENEEPSTLPSLANMNMDSRIQLHTVWALLDDSMPSVSVFAAGGGVRR